MIAITKLLSVTLVLSVALLSSSFTNAKDAVALPDEKCLSPPCKAKVASLRRRLQVFSNDDTETESNDDTEVESNDDTEVESNDDTEVESNDDTEVESNDDTEVESNDDTEVESNDDTETGSNDDTETGSNDDTETGSNDDTESNDDTGSNDDTSSGGCSDSSLRFKTYAFDGSKVNRDCSWVSKKATKFRCSTDGVSEMCSSTCNSCADCVDTSARFKVEINGAKKARNCGWVANKSTAMRCALEGVASACRATCGAC